MGISSVLAMISLYFYVFTLNDHRSFILREPSVPPKAKIVSGTEARAVTADSNLGAGTSAEPVCVILKRFFQVCFSKSYAKTPLEI